jgi:hypothetical protein
MPESQPPQNAVYMSEEFLWIDVVGDQTGASVRAMGEQICALVERLRAEGKPVLIMDDLRRIGAADLDALKGVAILARLIDYDKAVFLDHKSGLMRAGSNALLKSVGRSSARYFADVDAAKAWLRS